MCEENKLTSLSRSDGNYLSALVDETGSLQKQQLMVIITKKNVFDNPRLDIWLMYFSHELHLEIHLRNEYIEQNKLARAPSFD